MKLQNMFILAMQIRMNMGYNGEWNVAESHSHFGLGTDAYSPFRTPCSLCSSPSLGPTRP